MENIRKIVRRTERSYDRSGEKYDAWTDAFNIEIAYPRLIEMIVAATGPLHDKRILDVGCGSGRLMKMLAANGARVSGVDISKAYVERAQYHGLDAHKSTMLKLPFKDETFDVVVSYFSIDYVPRKAKLRALREQHRVLKPGGSMALTCWYTKPETPERLSLSILGEEFVLYPEQVPAIETLLGESGFCESHIAPTQCTKAELEKIARADGNPALKAMLERFEKEPFALTVVAKKS